LHAHEFVIFDSIVAVNIDPGLRLTTLTTRKPYTVGIGGAVLPAGRPRTALWKLAGWAVKASWS